MFTTLFAAFKSIPVIVICVLVAALIGYGTYDKIHSDNLKLALATAQQNVAKLTMSNQSLAIDNEKRQKEFEANIAEQQATAKNDATLAAQAKTKRDQIQVLSAQQETLRQTDPEAFLKQVNKDIGCDFEGFGNPITCDTDKPGVTSPTK